MATNSFVLAVPKDMQADLNTALAWRGHGAENIRVSLYRAGVVTHAGGHIWDYEGTLESSARGSWNGSGLTNQRVNAIKQALLYSVQPIDGVTGRAHMDMFCAANDFRWTGQFAYMAPGALAVGDYRLRPSPERRRLEVVYVLAAHERTGDPDPSLDPARYLVSVP